ncbi:MAG: MATE family efflux transporter [Bdellovibrio sp. 28-41-41]|nr:MAG: MATE family efflux transporter [Bdellovibrio sp. 28-41-41]
MTKLLGQLKKALKGEEHDYTQGNISDAVVLLSIPMILELSMESVFAVVDMFFVSKLGQNAIATVGLTESFASIIYCIAIGLSTGATAIVARRIGEKNPQAAAHAGAQSIVLALLASIILGTIGIIYSADILKLMGASPDVVNDGAIFAEILIGGNVVILLLFLINGIFRGAGNAAMAMRSLWLASGANIILCPILIHFYGLKGAAIATLLGRSVGVMYQCYHLYRGDGILKFNASLFKIDTSMMKSLFTISWPASLQFLIGSGSWILLTRLVAETGGTAASAGYQIAFRNFAFFILPAWGLSNAAATLVGQNIGAKQFERAEQSVYTTLKFCVVLMIFVTLFFIFLADPLIRIYTDDPEVTAYGIQTLRILGSGFIFYGIAMVMNQALNGAGDTKTPTRLNFICFWLFQTPFAYVLAKYSGLNATGAVIAIPVSQVLLALLAWHYFRKGKWKLIQV